MAGVKDFERQNAERNNISLANREFALLINRRVRVENYENSEDMTRS
jgi:hypothetical protein